MISPENMDVRIVNSTICCKLQGSLYLDRLPNARTYPKFPGASVRFDEFTAMFFQSGRINVLGLRNLNHLDTAIHVLKDYLKHTGVDTNLTGEVKNVVAVGKFGKAINLPRLHSRLQQLGFTCMLEQELYPALRVWPRHERWAALVYHTGKVIVTGAADVHIVCAATSMLLGYLT